VTPVTHIRVQVPATSGNLGPGFDSLGLAYQLYDELGVVFSPPSGKANNPTTHVTVWGEGSDSLPTDDSHLVIQAIRKTIAQADAPQPDIKMTCQNRIPHGRGLGSSAAAVVAGIAAAQAYLANTDPEKALALATDFDGHPDNAAPAISGGATVAWLDAQGQPHAQRLSVHPEIVPTLLVPQTELATKKARAALPPVVPHQDAAFNASRAALLVTALTQQPELLLAASEDRLHQDYRAAQMPASAALLGELRGARFAAVVSGAGPSLLVLTPQREVAQLDIALASLLPVSTGNWRVIRPGIDAHGAVARPLS